MRYIVYGAGAVGATIGALLWRAGREVTLVARGAHLDALRQHGLTFETPDGDAVLPIPAVGRVADAEVAPGDVVLLAMKTQHTAAALDALADAHGPGTPVVCAQNGVENERLALRRFRDVYAMYVVLPTEHLRPGVVRCYLSSPAAYLDVGRVSGPVDSVARGIARDLNASGCDSRTLAEPMRWKYSKLLDNLGNAVDALCGPHAPASELLAAAREEALRCYAAAGIDCASPREREDRLGELSFEPVHGDEHRGGSSWQSLSRGSGTIETPFLNGEIAMLGHLHGVPVPVNETLDRLALRAVRDEAPPASMSVAEVMAELGRTAAGGG